MSAPRALRPAGRIPPPDWMTAAPTARVLAALSAEGGTPRFVGGCVRDALLGLPAKDIDIAVPFLPEEALRLLRQANIRVEPTGLQHGTVTAIVSHQPFEITSLRVDVETFGRHARVAFTDDWQADAARRDFTINALYADADGTLYDPVGGLADLRARKVRFIGEPRERIAEDALRILRYFRFYARFNEGLPDAAAVEACAADAALIRGLSGERVREECLGILRTERAAEAWRLMHRAGVAVEALGVEPDLERLERLVRVEARHAVAPDAVRRLAALLPRGADVAALRRRLRLSNRDTARLAALVAGEPGLPAAAERPDGPPARRLLQARGAELVADLALLAEAGGTLADAAPLLRAAAAWQRQTFPLRGADLVERGVPPGPQVGRLLAEIEAWWMEGDFRAGRDACLAELDRRLVPGAGSRAAPSSVR